MRVARVVTTANGSGHDVTTQTQRPETGKHGDKNLPGGYLRAALKRCKRRYYPGATDGEGPDHIDPARIAAAFGDEPGERHDRRQGNGAETEKRDE